MKIKGLDNLAKINDNFTVTICHNGFLVEVNGQDFKSDWMTMKVVLTSMTELMNLLARLAKLPVA